MSNHFKSSISLDNLLKQIGRTAPKSQKQLLEGALFSPNLKTLEIVRRQERFIRTGQRQGKRTKTEANQEE